MCYFQLSLHSVADRRTEMTSSNMKHRPFVELLCISHPIQQQALLGSASHEQIRFLCNCLENFTYPKGSLNKPGPFKDDLADLADRSRSFRKKRKILISAGKWFSWIGTCARAFQN
jgi:hypothetical protein